MLEQGGHYVFVRPDRSHLDELGRLFDDGKLTVTIARTFELDDIADAHRLSEDGHPGGKTSSGSDRSARPARRYDLSHRRDSASRGPCEPVAALRPAVTG